MTGLTSVTPESPFPLQNLADLAFHIHLWPAYPLFVGSLTSQPDMDPLPDDGSLEFGDFSTHLEHAFPSRCGRVYAR